MLDSWLIHELVCPRDKRALHMDRQAVVCFDGHRYPVVDRIPVMLLNEVKPTHPEALHSLEEVNQKCNTRQHAEERHAVEGVDRFVQEQVAATNGLMYRALIGKLTEYPIPTLRIQAAVAQETYFLDIGCNWGRWCVAASRLGYRPVGVDCSLNAIRAACRVAQHLGVDARYVVADARHLPFRDSIFPVVFSYSVFQHFDKGDADLAFGELGRVLKEGGTAIVQMPNVFGTRAIYHQMRRGFRRARDFEVRYWRPADLKSTFGRLIGPATLSVDGYFTLNPQPGEMRLLPWSARWVVKVSEFLRSLSVHVTPMLYVADSLYVTASKLSPRRMNDIVTERTLCQ